MEILLAIIGSGVLSAIVSGIFAIINRKMDQSTQRDDIVKQLDGIRHRLDKSEKDSVRLQLMLLISDYPENTAEILEVARHYFIDLEANWYATALFNRWLLDNKIAKPEWFAGDK